jgi:Transposase
MPSPSRLRGEAGSRLLADVGVPASADTLLRLVKRSQLPVAETPKAIGVDDFALRRGQTYGTIIVDLSTHRPIDLLTERTAETLSQWLVEHPGIEFISRDRSSEYMRGATEGAPQARAGCSIGGTYSKMFARWSSALSVGIMPS